MKCIVVDDDPMARKLLSNLTKKNLLLNVIGECSDAPEAREIILKQTPDLVFLDVEMPGMSGLELIDSLRDVPQIILVSSNPEYAVDSYDYNVTDFIVKPITQERLDKAVAKAKLVDDNVRIYKKDRNFIFVKDGTVIKKVNLEDITWIEALGDYVSVHLTSGKKITILSTMKSMDAKMPDSFVRIHRSYIIAVNKIKEIEDNTVSLGDKLLPVSKHYKENFFSHLDLL